jgi:preprotein translocase subunit SecE
MKKELTIYFLMMFSALFIMFGSFSLIDKIYL